MNLLFILIDLMLMIFFYHYVYDIFIMIRRFDDNEL